MTQVRRFLVGAVLMAATAFVFSSCNKDDDTTEKGSGSNGQWRQNGGKNGENGGNGNSGGGGNNGGGENGGGNNGGNGGNNGGGSGVSGNHEYVDLGLPSGTKWATCNVGATKPEAYGDYFAWGETEEKETYTYENSVRFGVSYTELQANGVIDANGNLTARYDAATVNWGDDWRMPTLEEIKELRTLDNEYAEVNGVKGRKFIGNGNSLFLPFAGGYDEGELNDVGVRGYYWSAKASDDGWHAYYLEVVYSGEGWLNYYRSYGRTVRPVLRTK